MKKQLMVLLAVMGLGTLLTESQADMLPVGTYLDRMTSVTGTSAWYAAQAAPGFDTEAVAVNDPRDPATDVMNQGTNPYWFEYKAVPGETFGYLDVCLAVFDAGGSGQFNGIALSYSADGLTYTNLAPTVSQTYVNGGGGWSLFGRQYNLQELDANYVKINKYANDTYNWSTVISSVYLVVPEPASLMLLALGGLGCLRRPRR